MPGETYTLQTMGDFSFRKAPSLRECLAEEKGPVTE